MIEIGRDEYEAFIEMATRLSIIERMIEDKEKDNDHYIDISILKVVMGAR